LTPNGALTDAELSDLVGGIEKIAELLRADLNEVRPKQVYSQLDRVHDHSERLLAAIEGFQVDT
jgi:hypothetical protein